MKTAIVVPIKTNNTRLPGKTFRFLNGKPLFAYLFDTLREIKKRNIADIFIDSSDNRVLTIAKRAGFNTLKRPEEYNSDSTSGDELLNRNIQYLEDYDIIGWLHITTPFLSQKTIETAIALLKNNAEKDSLFGIAPIYNRCWFKGSSVNHDIKKLIRTQDLIPLHQEADFYFFKKESFKKYKKRVCGNFLLLEVSKIEGVDIDDLSDFVYAESLIKAGLVKA